MNLSGWDLDLPVLYGRWWKKRAEFHLDERLYESPSGAWAVLLFGIGEVGMNKQIGMAAVLRNRPAPRLVYHSGGTKFWFEGQTGEPVVFSDDGRHARVYQFTRSIWRPQQLGCRARMLDGESGRLLDG